MPPIPDEHIDTAPSAAVEIRVNIKTKDESEVVNGDTFRLEAESVESPLSDPHITTLLPAEIDQSEIESEVRFVLGQLISQFLQAHGDEDEYIIEYIRTSNGHNSDQGADEEEHPVNTVVLSEPPPPSASTSQAPPPIASAGISTAPLTVDISSTSSAVVVGDKKVAGEEEEEEEQHITPPMGASVPLSPTSATSAAAGGKNGTTLFVPTEVCYNYHCY